MPRWSKLSSSLSSIAAALAFNDHSQRVALMRLILNSGIADLKGGGIWASRSAAPQSGSLTSRHRLTRRAKRERPAETLRASREARHCFGFDFSISSSLFSKPRIRFGISPSFLKTATARQKALTSNAGVPTRIAPGATSFGTPLCG